MNSICSAKVSFYAITFMVLLCVAFKHIIQVKTDSYFQGKIIPQEQKSFLIFIAVGT